MELAPGTMVTPNVRLVELLGVGGMGSVWLADHLGLEARVAVKFLSRDLVALEPNLRQRFKREASICARIRSIHVVQTFDHGEMEDGAPYIVMELLEGDTVTQMVEANGPMPPRLVAMMVAQIVKVLHRAHVLGIIHRDIKPDNIIIADDSDYELFVKVLDFGIAKQERVGSDAPVTATGVVVGTPEFMSPEQAISSKNIDYRSDLFSLGVVTFYALTGELPYDHVAEEPLWMQMSTGKRRSALEFNPDLPPGIDRFFACVLQPRPEDRFSSARLMADALAAILVPEEASQIVDELSEVDGPSWPAPRPDPQDSHPAQYELIGPDSEEYGSEHTVQMEHEDHLAAEYEEPPTQRKPRPLPRTLRGLGDVHAARAALAAGFYNAGVDGAFNRKVSKTLIDAALAEQPVDQRFSSPSVIPARRSMVTPAVADVPKRRRWPAVIAVCGAIALVSAMVAFAWWRFT